jgi:hypothetical protein
VQVKHHHTALTIQPWLTTVPVFTSLHFTWTQTCQCLTNKLEAPMTAAMVETRTMTVNMSLDASGCRIQSLAVIEGGKGKQQDSDCGRRRVSYAVTGGP